jgi:hypothetical protein
VLQDLIMKIKLQKKTQKTVVCMTTFNRIDCARINQEIIKLNYSNPLPIVHACSGSSYREYLEDVYVPCEPASLHHGALNLLQRSLNSAVESFSPKYIVHLEGDTWIMNERVIYDIIAEMDRNKQLMICSSAWDEDQLAFRYMQQPSFPLRLHLMFAAAVRSLGFSYGLTCTDSLATQFFVIRVTSDIIECFSSLEYIPGLDLEQALYRAFMLKFGKRNILRLKEREPVHPYNRFVCDKLSLYSQHWPARGTANDMRDSTHPRYISPIFDGKRESLLRFPSIRRGEHIQKLLNSTTFEYYNQSAART